MEQREDGFKKPCLTAKASFKGERGNDLDYSFHFTLSRASQCGRVVIGCICPWGVVGRMLRRRCTINDGFQT